MTIDQLKTPQEVRVTLLTKVGHFINQAIYETQLDRDKYKAFSTADMLPYVDCNSETTISTMRFNCMYGEFNFQYSVTLNLGEIRISILIPTSFEAGTPVQYMQDMTTYDYSLPHSPTKTVKLVNDGLLLRHVFHNRFAEPEIMFRVLCANYTDDRAIGVLADAIAKELIMINQNLMDILVDRGYMTLRAGLLIPENGKLVKLDTKAQKNEILAKLTINKQQLYCLDEESYLIALPTYNSEVEAILLRLPIMDSVQSTKRKPI